MPTTVIRSVENVSSTIIGPRRENRDPGVVWPTGPEFFKILQNYFFWFFGSHTGSLRKSRAWGTLFRPAWTILTSDIVADGKHISSDRLTRPRLRHRGRLTSGARTLALATPEVHAMRPGQPASWHWDIDEVCRSSMSCTGPNCRGARPRSPPCLRYTATKMTARQNVFWCL